MGGTILGILVALLVVVPLAVAIIVFIIGPLFRGIAWVIGRACRFVISMIVDVFRGIGVGITSVCYLPFVIFNVIFGRWSRAQHYGRALQSECHAGMACLYRLFVGHPARLFGAEGMVEGLEQRLPKVVAEAPPGTMAELRRGAYEAGGAVPSTRTGQFPGYQVIGTLAGGGSGGKLYIARPDATKLSAFGRQGFGAVGDVVIKSFSMGEGSMLPQIVRENRALEAARKMGLVLEHELTNERFFYVMRYVPGESLGIVTPRLHAASGGSGLAGRELASAIGYGCDLLGTLHEYHKTGLWHKDVKPDNIIVSGGHAHLVDFGLVTPLRSSMTLTTHGTEYFRDPEMVRLALRGVKVHEVDGARFDVYAAGAVLYSMIENGFPAHGGLSQITRTCPEALRWIVRRAMTDYDKRYPSVASMLADLTVAQQAAVGSDATALRPADLPSVKAGEGAESLAAAMASPDAAFAHAPVPPPVGRWHGAAGPAVHAAAAAAAAVPMDFAVGAVGAGHGAPVGAARSPRVPGRSAKDQLAAARGRVAEMRRRADARMRRSSVASTRPNFGVAFASLAVVMAVIGGIASVFVLSAHQDIPIGIVKRGDSSVYIVLRDGEAVTLGDESSVFQEPPVPQDGNKDPRTQTVSDKRDRNGKSSGRRDRPAQPSAPPAPSKVSAGVTVLLMQESSGFDEAARQEIQDVIKRLRERGFTLISAEEQGDAPGAQAAIKKYVELAGDLRHAVGLRPLETPDAGTAVGGWLNTRDDVHAVLWITPERNEAGRVRKFVYTGANAPKGSSSAVDEATRQPG